MSLTILSSPPLVSLTGNDILLKIASFSAYSTLGQKNITYIEFSIHLSSPDYFKIAWGDNIVEIHTVTAANMDETGWKIREWDGFELMEEWVSVVAETLKLNYYLNRDFKIYDAPNNRIYFEALEYGSQFNLIVTEFLSELTSNHLVNGVDSVLRDFYKIYAEVSVIEPNTLAGELTIGRDVVDIDTSNRTAKLYVQEYLNAYLLKLQAETPDYDFPETSSYLIIQRDNLCKEYHIKYAESYGNPPVVQKLHNPSAFYALSGGLNDVAQKELNTDSKTFWNFIQENLMFLSWHPKKKVTDKLMPEKLYFLNFINRTTLNLILTVDYTDNTNQVVQKGTIKPYYMMVYECIVSMVKLDVTGVNPNKTVRDYRIHLTNELGIRVSEYRYYFPDFDEYLQKRYFMFRNSFNVMDTIRATGESEKTVNLEFTEHGAIMPDKFTDNNRQTIQQRAWSSEVFKTSFGYIKNPTFFNEIAPRSLIEAALDFCISPEKFEIVGNKKFAINITSTKINQYADGNTLYQFLEIEYKRAYTDEYYSNLNTSTVVFPDSFSDSFIQTPSIL